MNICISTKVPRTLSIHSQRSANVRLVFETKVTTYSKSDANPRRVTLRTSTITIQQQNDDKSIHVNVICVNMTRPVPNACMYAMCTHAYANELLRDNSHQQGQIMKAKIAAKHVPNVGVASRIDGYIENKTDLSTFSHVCTSIHKR